MNPIKFDYTPDPTHALLQAVPQLHEFLETQCPIKTMLLKMMAPRASSARLFRSITSGAQLVRIASLLDRLGGADAETQKKLDEARLFTAVAGLELAERYQNGALEPELHEGGTPAAIAWADARIAEEDSQQPATETDVIVSEHVLAEPSPVNGASDGIV